MEVSIFFGGEESRFLGHSSPELKASAHSTLEGSLHCYFSEFALAKMRSEDHAG